MSKQDFYEVEPTENQDGEFQEDNKQEPEKDEYEQVCCVCRRPERVAGKMIRIPGNLSICSDCMQKTFDAVNHTGFPVDNLPEMNRMPNISMINLADLQGYSPYQQKIKKKKKEDSNETSPLINHKRPNELEADVVRFQNNKEKWIAFVGLVDGRPYEIFTGLADDDDGIFCPKSVTHGKIIKAIDDKGNKRYDFQFINKRGYKTTIEGLSDKFNPEYWNYAKLISGVLRYGMPIDQVLKLVGGLELDSQSINTWKMGVERALKKYLPNGTKAKGQVCPNCGQETLVYQEGCLICTSCGTSRCG